MPPLSHCSPLLTCTLLQIETGEKGGTLHVNRLRKSLYRTGFEFGTGGDRKPITGEAKHQKAYRRKYLRRRMKDRVEGPLDTAKIEEIKEMLEGSDPPQRDKDVIKALRQTGGGFKRKWCSLDESYVCENQVHEGTLYETGGVVNQREGVGKRLCMGGCGIYWTDGQGESQDSP